MTQTACAKPDTITIQSFIKLTGPLAKCDGCGQLLDLGTDAGYPCPGAKGGAQPDGTVRDDRCPHDRHLCEGCGELREGGRCGQCTDEYNCEHDPVYRDLATLRDQVLAKSPGTLIVTLASAFDQNGGPPVMIVSTSKFPRGLVVRHASAHVSHLYPPDYAKGRLPQRYHVRLDDNWREASRHVVVEATQLDATCALILALLAAAGDEAREY